MATLDPTIDAEWLARLRAEPSDVNLREAYFAALVEAGDPRGELARIEAQVDAMRLDDAARPALKRRRDELRDAVDVAWRTKLDFGRMAGARDLLPWPAEAATRWLALCEYIEEIRGVRLPQEVWTAFASSGRMVAAWEQLIAHVRKDEADYWALFRDSIPRGCVPGWPALHSLMVQGEGDFHWAVADTQRDDEDPPVHGMRLDYRTSKFAPTHLYRDSNCTCYARVTDFVRGMFETYSDLGRRGRLLGGESIVPSRLFRAFAEPATPRPTCEELGTARLRPPGYDEERTTHLGCISNEEHDALAAMVRDASRPGAPDRRLTVMDASGRLRDDLDDEALVEALREGDAGLVDGPRNRVILLWVGDTEATLVLQTSEDRRYVLCHIDEDLEEMIATVEENHEGDEEDDDDDDDDDDDVGILVDGKREVWTESIFIERGLAAEVVARFIEDGQMDGCVEWVPRDTVLF